VTGYTIWSYLFGRLAQTVLVSSQPLRGWVRFSNVCCTTYYFQDWIIHCINEAYFN